MKSKIQDLIDTGVYSAVLKARQEGVSMAELAERYGVCKATLYKMLTKVKEDYQLKPVTKSYKAQLAEKAQPDPLEYEDEEDEDEEEAEETKTAYEILYQNRQEVVRLKKREHVSKAEIARIYGVGYQDVVDFFSMNKKLSRLEVQQIRFAYDEKGEEIEDIAKEHNVSPYVVASLVKAEYSPSKSNVKEVVREENTIQTNSTEVTDNIESIVAEFGCVVDFVNYINKIKNTYNSVKQKMEQFENEWQDVLHKLEFDDYTDREAIDITNKIKTLRLKRRMNKDFIQLTEPLIDFMQDKVNADVIDTLSALTVKIAKTASQMNKRVYHLRGDPT